VYPELYVAHRVGRMLCPYALQFVSEAGGIKMNTSENISSNTATLFVENMIIGLLCALVSCIMKGDASSTAVFLLEGIIASAKSPHI
jgi:hypothetical protein